MDLWGAGGRAERDGQTFVWREIGQGPPVILVHGFPDGPWAYERLAAALAAAGRRAIAPYLRGYHPDTVVSGRSYAADFVGEDVIFLLDAIGADSAPLIGHDWGASAVYAAAGRSPERVDRMVALGIPHPRTLRPSLSLLPAIRHFPFFKLPWAAASTRRGNFGYIQRLFARWAPSWGGEARDAAVEAAKESFSDPGVLHGALDYYRDFSFRPPKEGRAKTAVPGLVIGGTDDLSGHSEPFEQSCRGFDAECEVLILDGVGHWPHLEAPDTVIPKVVDFITAS